MREFLIVLFITACAHNSAQNAAHNGPNSVQQNFREEAVWVTYLEHKPSDQELRHVMQNGITSFFREAAAHELVKRRPVDINLLLVIESGIWDNTDFGSVVRQIFADRFKATNIQLIFGICYVSKEDLQEELLKALYSKNPSNEDLSWLLRCGLKTLGARVAERILENNPSDAELMRVRDYAPYPYNNIAADRRRLRKITKDDLARIVSE